MMKRKVAARSQASTKSAIQQDWPHYSTTALRFRVRLKDCLSVIYVFCLFAVLAGPHLHSKLQMRIQGCQDTLCLHAAKESLNNTIRSLWPGSSASSTSCLKAAACWSQKQNAVLPPPVELMLSNRHFGFSSHTFLGEWKGHPYQATIHIRPVCRHGTKHVRVVTSMTTAPHPYFRPGRSYYNPVTPAGWFSPDQGGMPEIWFTDFADGSRILVRHHVQEQEVNGHFLFDDDWFAQCWLSSADLGMDRAYTLSIQGSERSYQAVASGPCLLAHPMFYGQQQGYGPSAAAQMTAAAAAGPPAGSTAGGQAGDCGGCHHPCHTAIWTAPVQMEVANTSTFAYVVRQHLDYHMRLGMSGMWMMCDRFVCLELLRDSVLAQRAAEGRLVLWSWEHGDEADKPAAKQKVAMVLMRTAAYGTPALLDFRDFDEFLVIPSGQSVQQLLTTGGCLSNLRQLSQALITSKVTVSLDFAQQFQPSGAGELSAWTAYDVWVDALRALNYSSAPQAFYGWKAMVDPNYDYNFICHDHSERSALLGVPQVNMVNDSCAYNMHFVNWYWNRTTSGSIGGTNQEFVALESSVLDNMRKLYQPGFKHPNGPRSNTQSGCRQLARRFSRSAVVDCSILACTLVQQATRPWLLQWVLGVLGITNSISVHNDAGCHLHTRCVGSHSAAQDYWPAIQPLGADISVTRASELLKTGGSGATTALSRLRNKLISVTLVTRSAEILIGAALQSVATGVDACLLVYSSDIASPELTLRAASQAVGEKLIVQEIQAGQPLAPMLDSLLDWARQLGAGWALLIDQDQQLKGPTAVEVAGEVARARQAGVSQVNCLNTHLDYARPFLIDLSQAGSYVHDLYVQPQGLTESTLHGCLVSRPDKTPAWTERRAREALTLLSTGAAADVSATANVQDSDSSRLGSRKAAVGLHTGVSPAKAQAASFVKAEVLWTLGQQHEARQAWQECADAGERSMALTALCVWNWVRNADTQEKETAIANLIKILQEAAARSPELFWLAAFTKYYAEEYESAKRLALEAIKLGCFTGECLPQGRVHSDEARYEWPFDVLYYSLSKLGDAAGAEEAKAHRDMAKANRLGQALVAAV